MGLFSKKRMGETYVVIADEEYKQTYVVRMTEQDFQADNARLGRCSRFDNEKDAVKHAKSCMKHFAGWAYSKERSKL